MHQSASFYSKLCQLNEVSFFLYRNLREARDNALEEKQRVVSSEKEISSKYDQLLTEYVSMNL